MAKTAAADLRVECMWCHETMRSGHPKDKDQVSHGCCCACAAQYYTSYWNGPSECQFELVAREHETDDTPVRFNPSSGSISYRTDTYHNDTFRCKFCKSERTLETEPCSSDCDGENLETPETPRQSAAPALPSTCERCAITLDADLSCSLCGVAHSEQCSECKRWGYHLDTCSEVTGE